MILDCECCDLLISVREMVEFSNVVEFCNGSVVKFSNVVEYNNASIAEFINGQVNPLTANVGICRHGHFRFFCRCRHLPTWPDLDLFAKIYFPKTSFSYPADVGKYRHISGNTNIYFPNLPMSGKTDILNLFLG